jgi:hypothetical protein
VEKHGNPLDRISLASEISNIASTSAKVRLVSMTSSTNGKVIEKKLLVTMTVGNLKAMCTKLFKVEVIR